MIINGVSACWSSEKLTVAIEKLHQGTIEPLIGQLATEHIQLCPQHPFPITEKALDELMTLYPRTQFRLHSDVRTIKKQGYAMDLVDVKPQNMWYFESLAQFSKQLNAPAYTLHAGKRNDESLSSLWKKLKTLETIFDCPVGVEGHYPFKGNYWFLDSWQEYEQMLNSGVSYALDLSHLNIVAKREGWQSDLTQALLQSTQCIEIHISFNEGRMDSHILSHDNYEKLWDTWKIWLRQANPEATIFSEGNQVLEARRMARENQ